MRAYRWSLILALLLAAALRFGDLTRFPLRGDEAFAIRYWAAPLTDILQPGQGLAWREPHPLGTYVTFWVWKALIGESEGGMRLLSALVNLIGVAVAFALGRRLFRDTIVGITCAYFWAINPALIWHSQDARNYAMWAALSALAFYALVRAAESGRWRCYILFAAIALYMFFLETFFVALHGLYLLMFKRGRLRAWGIALLIIGVLLIPWIGQVIALAGSGYRGTLVGLESIDGNAIARFYDGLAFGATLPGVTYGVPTGAGGTILLIFYLLCLLQVVQFNRRLGMFLAMYFLIPLILLGIAATRMAVFDPRYIIAAMPAIVLPWGFLVGRALRGFLDPNVQAQLKQMSTTVRRAAMAMVLILPISYLVPAGLSLAYYYGPDYHKAPDWYAVRDRLVAQTTAEDTVIVPADPVTGALDPAFAYYYPGPANVLPLPYPNVDTRAKVREILASQRAVWLVVTSAQAGEINSILLEEGSLIHDDFPVREYRSKTVKDSEITTPRRLIVSSGGGILRGHGLAQRDLMARSGSRLIVLIFWEKLPASSQTGFIHLIGSPKADESPLYAQEDHPPTWLRDVYRLDLGSVPPGEYEIAFGLYESATQQPIAITDESGKTADRITLARISLTR